MITTPTVFILGAGASMNYHYPSGKDLVVEIRNNPPDLREFNIAPLEVKAFTDALHKSDSLSVDAFLEHQPKFLEIGRLSIAQALMKREHEERLTSDWYQYLLNCMICPFEHFKDNRVSFITFNYDRSLEQYLFTVLCNRYPLKPEDIAATLNHFDFVHVHGQLGYLKWQKRDAGESRAYTPDIDRGTLAIAANGIKIISEKIDGSPEFTKAQELMTKATNIFLLGFGYHHINLKRLGLPLGSKLILGTALGFTPAEQQKVQADYRGLSLYLGNALDFLRNMTDFQKSVTH